MSDNRTRKPSRIAAILGCAAVLATSVSLPAYAAQTGSDDCSVNANQEYTLEDGETLTITVSGVCDIVADPGMLGSLTLDGTPIAAGSGVYATSGTVVYTEPVGDVLLSLIEFTIGNGATVMNTYSITSATVADAPSTLGATPRDSAVDLSWSAPSNNGGRPITGYAVRYQDTANPGWTTATLNSTDTTVTITGLTNGTEYDFEVAAINAVGTSSFGGLTQATPQPSPDAPTGLLVTTGVASGTASLSWTAPSNTGGDAINDYVIEYAVSSGAPSWQTFADGTSTTTNADVTGLTNGTSYLFRVAATNSYGTGATTSEGTGTPIWSPDMVEGLAAIPGDSQVALSWSAATDNGSPVTDYYIEYQDVANPGWNVFDDGIGTSTSATVTGLTNGTEYEFRVAALNAVGDGPYSPGVSATPALSAPDAPVVTATAGDARISVSWTEPYDGGDAITGYTLEYSVDGDTWTDVPVVGGLFSARGATITGLTNGTTYQVRVSATNTIGTGAWSSVASATPAAAVTPPSSGSTTTPPADDEETCEDGVVGNEQCDDNNTELPDDSTNGNNGNGNDGDVDDSTEQNTQTGISTSTGKGTSKVTEPAGKMKNAPVVTVNVGQTITLSDKLAKNDDADRKLKKLAKRGLVSVAIRMPDNTWKKLAPATVEGNKLVIATITGIAPGEYSVRVTPKGLEHTYITIRVD